MNITSIIPTKSNETCMCKICGSYDIPKKNIGNYCYKCLRKYRFEYPEYLDPKQYCMYMKLKLEKEFDKPK